MLTWARRPGTGGPMHTLMDDEIQMNDAVVLEVKGVSKHYGGVRALNNVDFACRRHSIHAILGENGAGNGIGKHMGCNIRHYSIKATV